MNILSVAYPFAPVSTNAVGGAEQILNSLDRAIVEGGSRSVVVACEGSNVSGELFSFPQPVGLVDDDKRRSVRPLVKAAIRRALCSRNIDVVHMHGIDFLDYLPRTDTPILVTLHMPISWYPAKFWEHLPRNVQLQCVSDSQRRLAPPELSNLPIIQNGVPVEALTPVISQLEDYALVLGRVCPEKNIHSAFEAGTMAGTRVLLCGQIFPYASHQEYFEAKIEPHLMRTESPQHEFVGPVSCDQKRLLLSKAKCLLQPSLAPETSSLVAMEAFACGTPVVAFRSGALPEIVDDGRTGFLVDDATDMARAIDRVSLLDREEIWRTAKRRFSQARMIDQYRGLYARLSATMQPASAAC